MAGDWTVCPLEDCMAVIIDYRGKTPAKTSSGIPLITAKVVKGGRIETPDEFIGFDDYVSWMRRGIPEAGDVVVTTEAPLGEVAQLGEGQIALAQRLIALRGKPEILDNGFLKFLMQSEAVQHQLRARASGTTVLGIKQSELRRVLLTLPSLAQQRAIARILGALDDKIELNRQLNQTLEAIARAIFKSWFVDFDPVRAKMNGEPYPLNAATMALFPDRLVDSEMGEIPEGWEIGTIGDIAVNPRRGVQPGNMAEDTPYIGLEHMPQKSIALADWGSARDVTSNKFAFDKGDILFGKLRPYFHKVGVVPVAGVCSTDILVIAPARQEHYSYLLTLVSDARLIDFVVAASSGTRMPRTSWQDVARYKVALPVTQTALAFDRQVRPLVGLIQGNIHQSRTLAALRDILLPKLISGELRVPEAEGFVEETSG